MKYLIILLSIFTLSFCKIEEDESIILYVSSENEKINVGSQNAMFGIKTISKEFYDLFEDSEIMK